MTTKKELLDWIKTTPDDTSFGLSEGGLLTALTGENRENCFSYFDIGGLDEASLEYSPDEGTSDDEIEPVMVEAIRRLLERANVGNADKSTDKPADKPGRELPFELKDDPLKCQLCKAIIERPPSPFSHMWFIPHQGVMLPICFTCNLVVSGSVKTPVQLNIKKPETWDLKKLRLKRDQEDAMTGMALTDGDIQGAQTHRDKADMYRKLIQQNRQDFEGL